MTVDLRFYELVSHLWRDGEWAYFWTPNDGNGEKLTHWVKIDPLVAPIVPQYLLGSDCYFSVNPSAIRRSQYERAHNADITVANCLYAEFDCPTQADKDAALAKIKTWKHQPACINDSGGGLHTYLWLGKPQVLDTPEKRKRFTDLQWAFAQFANGDTSVNDLARVLRVIGTFNHKPHFAPNFPQVKIVEWDIARQYELSDLEPLLQPYIDARAASKAHTPSQPSGAVSLSDSELLDVLFKSKNGDLYRRLWGGDDLGDHSVADQKLCNGLAWLTGRDTARMDSLFRQSGLMRDKWRDRDDYRDSTLNNAANSAQTVYTAPTIDPQAQAAAAAAVNGSQPSSNGASAPQATTSAPYRAPNNPTSADYIKSLQSLGYHFRLNDLDDLVEVNHYPLDDVTAAQIRSQMRDLGYTGRHIGAMEDAYLAHAGNNRYHPIKDYLMSLQWDGDDHIRMLSGFFNDKHMPILYADGAIERVFYAWLRRWLIGAVAKIFEGGMIRAQNSVLVLEGGQNIGKSTFASWLCSGAPKHFIEQSVDPENKEHIRNLAGKWIWEIGELGATTRKADRESLKHFLTQTTVTFRTPYAKHAITKPALSSFIGTVNNEGGFLQDSTGTRRFMTVGITQIDHGYVNDIEVDQLWAQAFDLYRRGESWRLTAEEIDKRDELNGDYKVEDPYEGWIKRYFEIDASRAALKTPGWFISTQEVVNKLKTEGVTGDTRSVTMQLAATMKELGLEKTRHPHPSGPRGYWGVKVK